MEEISVVINTLNEEKNISSAISSVKKIATEIVVVDMESKDNTVKVAEKLGAKVYSVKPVGYVEPARNYAIAKVSKEWILILDADEKVPPSLAKKIKEIVKKPKADYYRIPRKNIIFNKWIEHTLWWPDYQIRLFRKGKVTWDEIIHSVPITTGKGVDLPAKEKYAILHNNYTSIEQYLQRMDRYTSIQAKTIEDEGYKFIWKDLITKPTKEFISRFFSGEGYKDGLHGLALSFLQAFSEVVLYLKLWQLEKFQPQAISLDEVTKEVVKTGKDVNWWINEAHIRSKNFISSLPLKIKKIFIK